MLSNDPQHDAGRGAQCERAVMSSAETPDQLRAGARSLLPDVGSLLMNQQSVLPERSLNRNTQKTGSRMDLLMKM